jgi:Rrf2 family protein
VELSCKSEYALLALFALAVVYPSGRPLQIRQIAAQQHIPDRYLEQLLATLRRGGFVRSQRGAKGGYLLAREPRKISLLEVVCCLEGLESCPLSAKSAYTLEGKIIREAWQEAQHAAIAVLKRYTLQDLAERRDIRQQVSLMYYI